MISYLKGIILLKDTGSVIIDVQGVGYKVFLALPTLQNLQEGKPATLFCFQYVKEDRLELYGFNTTEQLKMFQVLNNIQGIGPKAALLLSSLGSTEELRKAIRDKDARFFAGVKGIGTKKIQKVILELTGKLEDMGFRASDREDEAVQALLRLGFSASEARSALQDVPPEIKDIQQKIKEALKLLGKR